MSAGCSGKSASLYAQLALSEPRLQQYAQIFIIFCKSCLHLCKFNICS